MVLARWLAGLGLLPLLSRTRQSTINPHVRDRIAMKISLLAAVGVTTAGLVLGGIGSAAAQPDDYSVLIVSPNAVTDTTAYTAGPTTLDPGGQPGAMTVFTHRDGRTITDTVWVLADPAAAAAAISAAQGNMAGVITNPKSQAVAVGTNGQLVSGTSADGTQSVSVLYFTQGNAASTIEFTGPKLDPVPTEVAVEMGQQQDATIKTALGS